MTVERMRDAAYAANIPLPWEGAVAGYLNTRPDGDPLNPWTPADWAKFPKNRKLPIFVQSHPLTADPVADAWAALQALEKLGVPAGKGIRTVLDLETAVDTRYVNLYGGIMHWAGFWVHPYGSASTIFGNPPVDGYWVADFVGKPFMYLHPDVRMTQYTDNPPKDSYDSSAVKRWVYDDVAHWWV
jgi:hypothetical protein